jgi:endoribonuclease Dicer
MSWNAQKWQDAVQVYQVLVGTPETFRQAIEDHGYLPMDMFSLLIIDECHNATKSHPMARLMKARQVLSRLDELRVLGLTASFVKGALSCIELKRKDLETLFKAAILFVVPTDDGATSATPQVHDTKQYHDVAYEREGPEFIAMNEFKISRTIQSFVDKIRLQEPNKYKTQGWHVFTELGGEAFHYWLREGFLLALQDKAEALKSLPQSASHVEGLLRTIAAYRAVRIEESLEQFSPPKTKKFDKLVQLLNTLMTTQDSGDNLTEGANSSRGIIFVQQKCLCYTMTYRLNQQFGSNFSLPITGTGNMSNARRERSLDKFRYSRVPVLVATDVLEEGIDVSACNFVIRFTEFHTTKSHIQGSGRARYPNAQIFYFNNSVVSEKAGEAILNRAAMNTRLNSTAQELKQAKDSELQASAPAVDFPYPYKTISNGTECYVDFTNCFGIYNKYVQKVLRDRYRGVDEMFEMVDSEIVALRFPGPTGFHEITTKNVDTFWTQPLHSVIPQRVLTRLNRWECRELQFLYVAVVTMKVPVLGFILDDNNPNELIVTQASIKCIPLVPETDPGARVKLNITYRDVR